MVASRAPLAGLPRGELRHAGQGEPASSAGSAEHIEHHRRHAFRKAGVEPRITHRMLYPDLVMNLVRTGWGVAPMPKMLTSPEALGDLVALPFEEPLERDLLLIYPWDRPLPAAARALMAHIQRQVALQATGAAKQRQGSDRSRRPRRAVDET